MDDLADDFEEWFVEGGDSSITIEELNEAIRQLQQQYDLTNNDVWDLFEDTNLTEEPL